VILLHGWPYDIHSYVDVAPDLAAAGYRSSCPTCALRQHHVPGRRHRAQRPAVGDRLGHRGPDDALHIDKGRVRRLRLGLPHGRLRRRAVAGAGQGGRAGQRLPGDHLKAQQQPLTPVAELGWWYQYYFATERGVQGYTANRHDFNKLIWTNASPKWKFDDATYERSARPSAIRTTWHRHPQLPLAVGSGGRREAVRRDRAEAADRAAGHGAVDHIGSDFDGAAIDARPTGDKFTGKYDHRILRGIGHNVPQEAPKDFAKSIVDADRL